MSLVETRNMAFSVKWSHLLTAYSAIHWHLEPDIQYCINRSGILLTVAFNETWIVAHGTENHNGNLLTVCSTKRRIDLQCSTNGLRQLLFYGIIIFKNGLQCHQLTSGTRLTVSSIDIWNMTDSAIQWHLKHACIRLNCNRNRSILDFDSIFCPNVI